MQFSLAPSNDGFAIGEQYSLTSKAGLLKLTGKTSFGWTNSILKGIEKKKFTEYCLNVGDTTFKIYKNDLKTWEKAAQAILDKYEKMVQEFAKKEQKKYKGKATEEQKKALVKLVEAEATRKKALAKTDIQSAYEKFMPAVVKKAHDAVVKKMGKEIAPLKKHHGKAVFKAVLFTVAIVAVVLAAVALGPLGGAALAIGIAAVVVKAGVILAKGVKDIRAYLKDYNTAAEKAAREIDAACLAVDKALTVMDACHAKRDTLMLKVSGAENELMNAQKNLSGSEKEIADLRKKADKAKGQLTELENFIGSDTADLLKDLKAAKETMSVAQKKKPTKVTSTLETVMDFVDAVGTAAT